jgi:hypothetical protein
MVNTMSQVLVASQRVMKNAVAEKERRRAEGMLRVCGDLIDLDSSILLLKIHKHLKSILDAKASMVLIVDEVTNELICQTFDDVALDTPFTLPVCICIFFVILWKGWSYHKRQLSNSLVHNNLCRRTCNARQCVYSGRNFVNML